MNGQKGMIFYPRVLQLLYCRFRYLLMKHNTQNYLKPTQYKVQLLCPTCSAQGSRDVIYLERNIGKRWVFKKVTCRSCASDIRLPIVLAPFDMVSWFQTRIWGISRFYAYRLANNANVPWWISKIDHFRQPTTIKRRSGANRAILKFRKEPILVSDEIRHRWTGLWTKWLTDLTDEDGRSSHLQGRNLFQRQSKMRRYTRRTRVGQRKPYSNSFWARVRPIGS